MKPWYRKEIVDRSWRPAHGKRMDWYYNHVSGGYGRRSFRTHQERRENSFIAYDEELKGYNLRVRGNRTDRNLNPWVIEKCASRNWRKSWKEFTRYRKQWMKNLG